MHEIFPDVGINGNFYGKYVFDGKNNCKFVSCGRAVLVKDVYEELESGNEILCLEFITNAENGEKKIVEVPRAWLNIKHLSNLCKLGIDVFQHSQTAFFKVVQKQEINIPKTFRHSELGWSHANIRARNIIIFKSDKTIGDIESSYIGEKQIGEKGSYKRWHKLILDEVIGRIELEMAVILGLSATLIGYLNLYDDTETLLTHICGDTSTGKTTAARLAVSVAGNPSFVGNTLMSTFQSTKNAITKNVAGNHGLPQVFDELSMFTGNLTDLIYTLSSGKEKARLSRDSTMKKSENWATTIITTGEKNILNGLKQNAGLNVRVLVFDSINWTKDAKQAERIANIIEKNYGFATIKIAKYLLGMSKSKVQRILKYWRSQYVEQTKVKDNLTDRVSRKYALLLATASIARKALDLPFNRKKLIKFFIKNENAADFERDLGLKAYSLFLGYVETNRSGFGSKIDNKWTTAKGYQNFGITEHLKEPEKYKDGMFCNRHIIIAETKFSDFCTEYGFEDAKIVLKNWKSKDLLKCEKDRLISERKISYDGNVVKCYIVRVIENHISQPNTPKIAYTITDGAAGDSEISL